MDDHSCYHHLHRHRSLHVRKSPDEVYFVWFKASSFVDDGFPVSFRHVSLLHHRSVLDQRRAGALLLFCLLIPRRKLLPISNVLHQNLLCADVLRSRLLSLENESVHCTANPERAATVEERMKLNPLGI